jgi:O-antigen/teichoic acid export membrane protein
MSRFLGRLVRSLAAYQVADVVSKFIAVILLPVYTRYIHPAGYGVVELLGNGVILISIVVRFGMIEAFLRYYFVDTDQARRDALVRRAAGFLLLATTVVAGALAAAASPLSRLILSHTDATTFRIAVLGMWTFTNLELAYALLRVDERRRAYTVASLINVAVTVASSVVLVVVLHEGARGLLLGNYATSTVVLAGLWLTMRHRLAPRPAAAERWSRLLRFVTTSTTSAARRWLGSIRSRSSSPARSHSSCGRSSTRGHRSPTPYPATKMPRGSMGSSPPTTCWSAAGWWRRWRCSRAGS